MCASFSTIKLLVFVWSYFFFQIEGKGFFILSSAATRVLIRIINIVNNITYILYYEREI